MVKMNETVGGRMLSKLSDELSRSIMVPNNLLPEYLHSKRGHRTLSSVKRLSKIREEKLSKHKMEKAIKARNIKKMAAFYENNPETDFDYSGNEINDDKLYRHMMAMVSGMVAGGLIDADELVEE